ncbi:MAG: hypothetical protein R2698_06715 [Microthrixaceae bacterium]
MNDALVFLGVAFVVAVVGGLVVTVIHRSNAPESTEGIDGFARVMDALKPTGEALTDDGRPIARAPVPAPPALASVNLLVPPREPETSPPGTSVDDGLPPLFIGPLLPGGTVPTPPCTAEEEVEVAEAVPVAETDDGEVEVVEAVPVAEVDDEVEVVEAVPVAEVDDEVVIDLTDAAMVRAGRPRWATTDELDDLGFFDEDDAPARPPRDVPPARPTDDRAGDLAGTEAGRR